MQRIISLTLFVLLTFSTTSIVFAANTTDKESRTEMLPATEAIDDFNFDENSFNISDEQFNSSITSSQNLLEEKVDFRTQIINSSHFTPNSPYKNARGSREENK